MIGDVDDVDTLAAIEALGAVLILLLRPLSLSLSVSLSPALSPFFSLLSLFSPERSLQMTFPNGNDGIREKTGKPKIRIFEKRNETAEVLFKTKSKRSFLILRMYVAPVKAADS